MVPILQTMERLEFTLRGAEVSDLPEVYQMLNSPMRESFLIDPLAPQGEFIQQTTLNMEEGRESYYLLEQDSKLKGLIRILRSDGSCEIWGRSLRTLFYHCARIAFEELNMPSLCWYVRNNNRRMLHICELFQIRKIGEAPFYTIGEKLNFLTAGVATFFEFLSDEYEARLPIMKRNARAIKNFEKSTFEN